MADVSKKRTFGLFSHAQAGKTTLAEGLLFACAATTRKGTIADGTTTSDYNADEIERKNSISASLLNCTWQGFNLQFIDTPGYADFIGEVISSLRAIDAGIIIVDAASGIEVGTERVWGFLEELNLPCLIFVNKLDKENTDFNQTLKEIQAALSKNAYPLSAPYSKQLVEAVAEADDALLEKYLEGKDLTEDELKKGLCLAVKNRKLFPVLSGSGLSDDGIKPLLDAIVGVLPSPIERPKIKGINPDNNQEKEIAPSPDGSFCAFVFKTISDPYVGQLSVFRVFSGKLVANTTFFNANKSTKERFGQIYILQGKEQRSVDAVSCGDIAAIAKLKDTATSDTLCDEKDKVIMEKITFPETVISASVKPKSRQDEDKISDALTKLSLEDLTFKISRDTQTKELIIAGMGDQHLVVMVNRMKSRFNVEVEVGTPKVPYKETISRRARVQGKHKKQSGGRGQYGDVWIEVEPLPRGGDFEFVDKIFGGAIPRNYIPSVEKGVRSAMAEGVVAGYPLVDVKVTLVDGSYHEVDSSDIAFQIAGRKALRAAVQEAGPCLLEPIMNVEVMVPDEYIGQISGDLNSRRGRIMGVDARGRTQIVKAQAPLAEMFKYANDLRSLTGGRGAYAMNFSHYEEVPAKAAQVVISQSPKREVKEE